MSDFENLQPSVVVPVVALELSDVTNDDVISYSRFWRNDMCCAVHNLSKQAKLENTHYELDKKNTRLEQSTVPVSNLGDSSTTDVLGLMHERTGHQNKRSLIECVKSRLVTGLAIEEKLQAGRPARVCHLCPSEADTNNFQEVSHDSRQGVG